MPDIGHFTEPTARLILETVRQLIASGYALPGSPKNINTASARPIQFLNDESETIPPYACMQITGMVDFGRNLFKVKKYSESVFGGFLFNGSREVLQNGIGTAQIGPSILAKRLDTDSVSIGKLWGAHPSNWYLKPNGGPWIAAGEEGDEALWVQRDIAATYRGVVTTTVTARSGTTDGAGVVTLRAIGASGATAEQQTGVNVTSLLSDTVTVGGQVVLARTTNGKLQVISEDCAS